MLVPIMRRRRARGGGVGGCAALPTDNAGMAILGVPNATHIWPLQEAAGNLVDTISADTMAVASGATQGNATTDLCDGQLAVSAVRGVADRVQCADTTVLDLSVSHVGFMVFKTSSAPVADFMACRGTGPQWWIQADAAGPKFSLKVQDATPTLYEAFVNQTVNTGDWERIMWKIDLTANTIELITTLGNSGTTSIAGHANLVQAAVSFNLFARAGAFSCNGSIAYFAAWTGANAEAMGQTEFDLLKDLG